MGKNGGEKRTSKKLWYKRAKREKTQPVFSTTCVGRGDRWNMKALRDAGDNEGTTKDTIHNWVLWKKEAVPSSTKEKKLKKKGNRGLPTSHKKSCRHAAVGEGREQEITNVCTM